MEAIKRAPGKVNLSLLVGPKNHEGFHELFTVFAAVDLYDGLDIRLKARPVGGAAGDLIVKCRSAEGDSNLAFKALKLLEVETGWAFDGSIHIDKQIPVGGGMGGGSSDGACALLSGVEALAEAGGPKVSRERQVAIARQVGADVAFFLDPRPSLGRGIGEILEPVALPVLSLVVVTSDDQLSTALVYRAFDETEPSGERSAFEHRSGSAAKRWHQVQDAAQVASLLENDLERSTLRLMPALGDVRAAMIREGVLAAMVSGSGPTLFGVCGSPEDAQRTANNLVARGLKAKAVGVTHGVA
jgi:4-diphosphocytidyl-2-C-methyl-D-erythritol kinase